MPEVQPVLQPQTPIAEPKKKINWKIISIIVVVAIIILAATGYTAYALGLFNKSSQETAKTAASPVKTTTSSAQKDETTWVKYTNTMLGFSMDLPEEIDISYFSFGKTINVTMKVAVFEDGDIVYISTDKDIVCKDGQDFSQTCETKIVANSLDRIKNHRVYSGSWKLTSQQVSNDSELESFLKQNFGSACSLGEKKSSVQNGVFDVEVKGDGKEPSISKCYLYDTRYAFKYYPAGNKAITWQLGLQASFCKNKCYDEDMAKSFEFL